MNIEFHYYITYILAANAGFSSKEAEIIAYASQYVDDNQKIYIIEGEDGEYKNYISQTMDITKPKNELIRIYPCFHFLPGDPDSSLAKRNDGVMHILNTTPNSKNAKEIMDEALATKNLYRIGICTHCYVDTWAHQNFVGYKHSFCKMTGLMEKAIPNIGHADAKHQPDIPNLNWEDKRLISANQEVHNINRFIEAAKNVFTKYCNYNEQESNGQWDQLNEKLVEAMGKTTDKKRISAYKSIVPFIPEYSVSRWFDEAIKTKGVFRKKYYKSLNFEETHWYKFQKAVKAHQKDVIKFLKSRFEQIGLKIANF